MPQVTLDLTAEELKALILQLPPQELRQLAEIIEERLETLAMMQLAETGFQEWNEKGEDLYDAET